MPPRTDPAGTPLGDAFHVFDTTLRDGAQREGITYSVADKLAVARLLDELGVGFIEGGWPGAHAEGHRVLRPGRGRRAGAAARRARRVRRDPQGRRRRPRTTRRCGRCSTRRRRSSRWSRSPTGGTSSGRCAPTWPRTARWSPTPSRSCAREGRRVFLDCRALLRRLPRSTRTTALRVLDAAVTAGADVAVLCDTNGGMLPLGHAPRSSTEVARRAPASGSASTARTTPPARSPTPSPRSRRARRTSSAPPTATASGPATPTSSPSSANLQLKLGMPVLPDGCLGRADPRLARHRGDRQHRPRHPPGLCRGRQRSPTRRACTRVRSRWIRSSTTTSNPVVVGNGQRILVTEMAGRASVELKGARARPGPGRPSRRPVARWSTTVKELEAGGWSFEAADASFELLVRAELGRRRRPAPFALESYRVLDRAPRGRRGGLRGDGQGRVDGERVIATAEGNGPVNALDEALRAALDAVTTRGWRDVELADYKVRILARAPRHGRGHPGAGRDDRRRRAATGPRSACTRTSWRRAGRRCVDAVAYAGLRQGAGHEARSGVAFVRRRGRLTDARTQDAGPAHRS